MKQLDYLVFVFGVYLGKPIRLINESVTFTATIYAVYPYIGIPTGTVTFKDGNKILGTSTLNAQSTYSTATDSTSLLSKGTHLITAVYVGDAYFTGNASAAIAQIVNK
ncbi:MAG: Ig-like domain-containing protein [Dehalococcoidales bacterium]